MFGNVQKSRLFPSWIDAFVDYLEDIPAPDLFKTWAGVSCVAGALERRTYAHILRGRPLHPNLYILLVGVPATGKSLVISEVKRIWGGVGQFSIADDLLSRASMVDALASAIKTKPGEGEMPHIASSLLVAATEFGNLVGKYDPEYMNVLNQLYDCEPQFREKKRYMKDKGIIIEQPSLHIIAGTQPSFIGEFFPERAFGMGIMSRLIMVYAEPLPDREFFGFDPDDPEDFKVYQHKGEDQRRKLTKDLEQVAAIVGEFRFTKDCREAMNDWARSGLQPVPEHDKLESYRGRRKLNISKLCMVFAASRNNKLLIEAEDFLAARKLLVATESRMAEIFHGMNFSEDNTILQSAYHFLAKKFKNKEFSSHALVHYLQTKMPVYKVGPAIELMEKSNMIKRVNKNLNVPGFSTHYRLVATGRHGQAPESHDPES